MMLYILICSCKSDMLGWPCLLSGYSGSIHSVWNKAIGRKIIKKVIMHFDVRDSMLAI